MRPLPIGIALLLAAALALPALAAPLDPALPRLDGRNEWHTIGPTAKTTQSKCIGQTTTPVCAIETVEACLVRHDLHLCKIASGPLLLYLPDDNATMFMKYRIDSARKIGPQDIGPGETPGIAARLPGDIEVGIERINCTTATECQKYWYCHEDETQEGCDEPISFTWTVLLRHVGARWNVAAMLDCRPDFVDRTVPDEVDGMPLHCPHWHGSR